MVAMGPEGADCLCSPSVEAKGADAGVIAFKDTARGGLCGYAFRGNAAEARGSKHQRQGRVGVSVWARGGGACVIAHPDTAQWWWGRCMHVCQQRECRGWQILAKGQGVKGADAGAIALMDTAR